MCPSALVVRILDASRHQHLDGDRHPDGVRGTAKVWLSRSELLANDLGLDSGSYPSMDHHECCGRHSRSESRFNQWPVEVLWQPTFKESLSAMTRGRIYRSTRTDTPSQALPFTRQHRDWSALRAG